MLCVVPVVFSGFSPNIIPVLLLFPSLAISPSLVPCFPRSHPHSSSLARSSHAPSLLATSPPRSLPQCPNLPHSQLVQNRQLCNATSEVDEAAFQARGWGAKGLVGTIRLWGGCMAQAGAGSRLEEVSCGMLLLYLPPIGMAGSLSSF
jgi:hypothetical protein